VVLVGEPCQNGGVCSDFTTDKSIQKPTVDGAGGATTFRCECVVGFSGDRCEEHQTGTWHSTAGACDSWGGAVDYCIAHGAQGLCPLTTICPDGPGAAPVGGRRTGQTIPGQTSGDDQWTPYGGDGDNRWVQTGVWLETSDPHWDPQTTCTEFQVLNVVNVAEYGGVSAAAPCTDRCYIDWVMCCGEGGGR
jgi:hypothetical protein